MRTVMSGSSSANLDGAIGHATLNPQGDHSRTQLVLTPQSLNLYLRHPNILLFRFDHRKNVAFAIQPLPLLLSNYWPVLYVFPSHFCAVELS